MLFRESKNRLTDQHGSIPHWESGSLLRLQVSVDDVMSMAILDSADHLLEEPPGLIFAHLLVSAALTTVRTPPLPLATM